MSSVVPLRSSSCQSPDLVLSRPFPPVLTTMAFDHSRRRWFETCSCKPVSRGLPSSIKQLHTLGPPRPFALVAHSRRRSVQVVFPGQRLSSLRLVEPGTILRSTVVRGMRRVGDHPWEQDRKGLTGSSHALSPLRTMRISGRDRILNVPIGVTQALSPDRPRMFRERTGQKNCAVVALNAG